MQAVCARRDGTAVEAALARGCARVHASEGEIVEALQSVWGTYTETPVF